MSATCYLKAFEILSGVSENKKTASLEKKKEKGGKSAKALGKRRKKGSTKDAQCPII